MTISADLAKRSNNVCELCGSDGELYAYNVPPTYDDRMDEQVAICGTCQSQLSGDVDMDPAHWRCLNDSMWSEHQPVQIAVYQILDRLKDQDWSRELMDMMYLDEEAMKWAQSGIVTHNSRVIHKDALGIVLSPGDSVVLVQDLNVKGGGFTAKRGTKVSRISLVSDNAEHIEGRVNDQRIVILTKYVKKV